MTCSASCPSIPSSFLSNLLGVNGVGPKMALNILSIGNGSEVRVAIAGGDTKFISQAQGVGKRVAERVVVELKDKVGLEGVDLRTTGMLQGEGLLMKDEAVEALVSLGYSRRRTPPWHCRTSIRCYRLPNGLHWP
jgi:Holliday junction DNA helicase RuvA